MQRLLCGWLCAILLLGGMGQAQADYIFTTLDVPDSFSTSAHGINDAGRIVGTYGAGYAFLYSEGQYTTLDAPGPSNHSTDAWSINAGGQVVGNAQ
jgi:probable HAF family extracellular repeat protein